MQRTRTNSARLARIARNLAQAPKVAPVPIVDSAESHPNYVNGGKRPGKRRRGNSVTKRPPNTNVRVTTFEVRDEYGQLVDTLTTLRYKRQPADDSNAQ